MSQVEISPALAHLKVLALTDGAIKTPAINKEAVKSVVPKATDFSVFIQVTSFVEFHVQNSILCNI
jgi:hypothetical protein